MTANLATSLSEQGKHTATVEIEREVVVLKTRLLGAEHKSTLTTATNLGLSLYKCGQQTEAGQLLRDTLAMSRRTLGSTHDNTQYVLRIMRSLGLAAR